MADIFARFWWVLTSHLVLVFVERPLAVGSEVFFLDFLFSLNIVERRSTGLSSTGWAFFVEVSDEVVVNSPGSDCFDGGFECEVFLQSDMLFYVFVGLV